ncbi:MAG TPA: DUF3578 domain-containing protein [Jatrophihabitans sp.]|nr:DUF3578 domain-containing protein [Jatrophihabitans sp.]
MQLIIDLEFKRILLSSDTFSTSVTPSMLIREGALGSAKEQLQYWLNARQQVEPDAQPLRAEKGGRQSAFSPTAWLRIYSPVYSRRATEGFYLVYLFAADGSAVYLSLNQGTSEYRSNAMRPISDPAILRSRAVEARSVLADYENNPVLKHATIDMDLGTGHLHGVGRESRRRIRNYEAACVYALRYERLSIPDDSALVADLDAMIPLLRVLYDEVPIGLPLESPRSPAGGSGRPARSGAGRQMDAACRREIEVYAENCAISWLGDDWQVERVGHLKRGYDLLCRRGDRELHIEVKGTVTLGEEVRLTRNEVRHLRCGECAAEHAFFVMYDITLSSSEGIVRCSGGAARVLQPWTIEEHALTATEYVYRLPRLTNDQTLTQRCKL